MKNLKNNNKVKVIGNGHNWTARPSSCFLINDFILVDVPQGVTKALLGEYDFSHLRYILITHCHSDHFADLHIVWEYIRNLNPEYKVKVIAPKGALKKLLQLYKALDTPRTKKRILTFFEFVELKPGDKVVFEKFSVKAYKMEHNIKHSLGYVLNFNNHTVGFSGDACLCYGVEQLIKDCKVVFIDSSSLQSNKKTSFGWRMFRVKTKISKHKNIFSLC